MRIAGTPGFIIENRYIGGSAPPYMVAEMSANHLGDPERALLIIEAAAEAGADAVKLQTYTADTLTLDHAGPGFLIEDGPWAGRTLYDLYQEAHTPWEWHEALFAKGREVGITVFSSPFDSTAVSFLERLECPAYKIASFEISDLPLIEIAAATGKPLIISTGIADREDIRDALSAARQAGCRELALLHCVSAYPAPPEEYHLKTIMSYAGEFGVPVGLSDHTLGTAVSVASIGLGTTIIEKHLTLNRADGGPDAAFSLEPDEFRSLCKDCITAWQAMGTAEEISPSAESSRIFRRSLFIVEDVHAGDAVNENNVRSIRPDRGLEPKYYREILGKRFSRDLPRATPLEWNMLEP